MQNSPEAVIAYNREEQTFLLQHKLYTLRSVEGVYIIGNDRGIDLFYCRPESPFMNYPEQVSIYTRKCKLPAVKIYMFRLNRICFETIPERWLEIWIIALFKNLWCFYGEEYLISSSVLNKDGQFQLSSYENLIRMYDSFMDGYPDSVVANFPYTRNTYELDFLLSAIYEDGLHKYFKPVNNADMQACLITEELQLAYAEIYAEENIAYLHYTIKAIKDVNDAVLSRKTFVVFKDKIPVFAFCTEFEKLMLSE